LQLEHTIGVRFAAGLALL